MLGEIKAKVHDGSNSLKSILNDLKEKYIIVESLLQISTEYFIQQLEKYM